MNVVALQQLACFTRVQPFVCAGNIGLAFEAADGTSELEELRRRQGG